MEKLLVGIGIIKRIIISPGIKISGKNKHPIVKLAENHKVKLQNEIELYFEQKPKSIIIGIQVQMENLH